ncbi:MAG TPA: hypothetical protein ENI64_08030 [Gammaproteobacteria bacterium]|nr:hypothetical protein [Gammaproteobacteria bacterium]
MDRLREAISRLNNYLDEHRVKRAILSTIPGVGTALDILIYGDDLEKLIEDLQRQSEERQQEIINRIDEVISKYGIVSKTIVTIGSGNAENILECMSEVEIGSKHQVSMKHEYGGSAVNVTTRLLSMEHDVYPVITTGRDRLGNQIRDRLRKVAEQSDACTGVLRFINSKDFQAYSIETPSSTVIVSGSDRTIFSQPPGKVGGFRGFMDERLDAFTRENRKYPRVVMIGHIYADSGDHEDLEPGECTISIINRFRNRSLIHANFGNSQIKHQSEFWEDYLDKISIFQLNIKEAKKFFQDNNEVTTLTDIIKWFMSKNINAVITLDKFGAVATHKDYSGVIIAWPIIERIHVKDTTGAGDAFAAGMASVLCENTELTCTQFQSALEVARIWAAESCKHVGASVFCPNIQDIEDFNNILKKEARKNDRPIAPIVSMDMRSAYDILSLIDIAFS